MLFGIRVLLLAAVRLTLGAPVIKIDFYGQAGCSHCLAFMRGALNKTLSIPSFAKQIEFEYFPFGNAYFVTRKCRGGDEYDILSRKCYDANCGKDASHRADDCFGPGNIICQNGEAECAANRYVACAKSVTTFLGSTAYRTYLPYAACIDSKFENNPQGANLDIQDLASRCGTENGLNVSAVSDCFGGPEGDAAVKAQAIEMPAHSFCPVVVVNGEMLDWGKETTLLRLVCDTFLDPALPKPLECVDDQALLT